ncbi:SigE family RNA polymerase sigma factor [Micromonospora chersina]|uniref:SigE family RNA polymerase sigma factor n=1 Tax=Micromonospora chersina TaxID=47854 RepID=UPI00378B4717
MAKSDDEFRLFVADRLDQWRRTAYLLCRDSYVADDLVSITLGKLYRHWRKVSRADNPDAYAHRVLTREWMNEVGRPWRRETAHGDLPDVAVGELDPVADRDELARWLAQLGPRQRAVIVMRFYLSYSVEETAAALGIAEGTVKSQSARGLHTLRGLAAMRS